MSVANSTYFELKNKFAYGDYVSHVDTNDVQGVVVDLAQRSNGYTYRVARSGGMSSPVFYEDWHEDELEFVGIIHEYVGTVKTTPTHSTMTDTLDLCSRFFDLKTLTPLTLAERGVRYRVCSEEHGRGEARDFLYLVMQSPISKPDHEIARHLHGFWPGLSRTVKIVDGVDTPWSIPHYADSAIFGHVVGDSELRIDAMYKSRDRAQGLGEFAPKSEVVEAAPVPAKPQIDEESETWNAHESTPYPCAIASGFRIATYYAVPPTPDGFKTVASMFVRDLLTYNVSGLSQTEIVGAFDLAPNRWERGDSKSMNRYGVIVDSTEWADATDVVTSLRALGEHLGYAGLRIAGRHILTAERARVEYRAGSLLYWIEVERKMIFNDSTRWMITMQNFAPRIKSR